jgi:hypothetical protein
MDNRTFVVLFIITWAVAAYVLYRGKKQKDK